MLLFIDETGCDRRDVIRKFGYSLVGKPAYSPFPVKVLEHLEHLGIMGQLRSFALVAEIQATAKRY